jgi:hypothetical protein
MLATRMRMGAAGVSGGGGPSGDTPPVAGYVMWLAARKETAFSDNDTVQTWTDQSGNGHHATAPTETARPVFKTNILNGEPVLRFDGTWDQLGMGDLSSVYPTAATVFVVATISSGSYNLYTSHGGGVADVWWSFGGTGYFGPFRTGRYSSWPSGVPTTGSHLWVVKSATGTGTYEVIIDNTSKGTQNATHDGGTEHGLSLNRKLTGDIAEVIAYNTALSQSDIDSVEAYLNGIYALWA